LWSWNVFLSQRLQTGRPLMRRVRISSVMHGNTLSGYFFCIPTKHE
jgi:hypothetical protein